MVDMSEHHRPIDLDATPPDAVVEFGAPEPDGRRPRWSAAGFGQALAGDRRAVPVAAALAAVAAFASLVSEWQVTTVSRNLFGGEVGERVVPTEFTDLGALGAGYLAGVFVLAAAVVLTLFGPAAGRPYARLSGLSAAGTLLAVLFAAASSLSDQSRTIPHVYTLELEGDELRLTYGRGVWCAFAAVLLALLALGLAGRRLPAGGPPPAGGSATGQPFAADTPTVDGAAGGWSWRRPRHGAEEEDREPDEPLELTVGPAKPFTPYADDRDLSNGSGRPGISG